MPSKLDSNGQPFNLGFRAHGRMERSAWPRGCSLTA